MPHVKCYLLLTKCKFKLSICNCKRRIPLEKKLIHGPITKSILLFSAPIILGNLLQQLYNVVDTLIVGRFLGADALAAVGSSFTLIDVYKRQEADFPRSLNRPYILHRRNRVSIMAVNHR